MGPMEHFGAAIAEVAGKVGASTVGVGNRWRGGSGIVLEKGRILTNAHNLHGEEIHVYFADGREAAMPISSVFAPRRRATRRGTSPGKPMPATTSC